MKTKLYLYIHLFFCSMIVSETFGQSNNEAQIIKSNNKVVQSIPSSKTSTVNAFNTDMKVEWLTGLTYGVSFYRDSSRTFVFEEIVVDTGAYCYMPTLGSGPAPGIYNTSQFYFTYTFPYPGKHTIAYRGEWPDSTNFGGLGGYAIIQPIHCDSSRLSPLNCHASFFMAPSDSTLNNWTIQDFSTGAGNLSYYWDFGDGTTSTLSTPSHTYSTVGMYTICLTVSSDSCSDTHCATAFVDTSVGGSGMLNLNAMRMDVGVKENTLGANVVQVFPNPASDELNLSFENRMKEDAYVTIVDLIGRQQLHQRIEKQTESYKLSLDRLATGIYLLQMRTADGAILLKEKIIKN